MAGQALPLCTPVVAVFRSGELAWLIEDEKITDLSACLERNGFDTLGKLALAFAAEGKARDDELEGYSSELAAEVKLDKPTARRLLEGALDLCVGAFARACHSPLHGASSCERSVRMTVSGLTLTRTLSGLVVLARRLLEHLRYRPLLHRWL